MDLTTALWGSRSECHEVSEARYSNSHLVVVGNCPLLFVRSALVHSFPLVIVLPLPIYYYAVYLYIHSQCITARRTNARLKLTLARDIGVVVEEEGMVNCSPLDSCSGQWRSWQRWGMATSSTWLLVRRTRHHCILYLPSHPPQCGYCKETESGDIIVWLCFCLHLTFHTI